MDTVEAFYVGVLGLQPLAERGPRMHTTTPECRLVRPSSAVQGKQELLYDVGISAESVGAHGIHMQIVRIPTISEVRRCPVLRRSLGEKQTSDAPTPSG
jgi:hypothetical protein